MMEDDGQMERVKAALQECDKLSVSTETVQVFFDFLSDNLSLPCDVITAGEFERYQLDYIKNSGDILFGLLGKVRLLSDESKQSLIPLCDLKAVNNRSKNFQLLNDYTAWFIAHQ